MKARALATFFSIFLTGYAKEKIIARIPSPDHALDAHLAARETDATVEAVIVVYIVHAREDMSGAPVYLADKGYNTTIKWVGRKRIMIAADHPRVFLQKHDTLIRLHGTNMKYDVRFLFDPIIQTR